jgi:spermidine/putrescine transport system ATP-binding protein
MSEPMIILDRVSRSFGKLRAVDDVSLEIDEGEFFSMLGPSGCGKTTTLRLIAGFEEPDAGRVLLAGEDVTLVSPRRRNVNMVFQDYALFPHMTVGENVEFGLRLKRVGHEQARDRVAEILTVVQLEGLGGRRPAELSGGQRQRVALARALVNRPAALLLDEPLGALDLKLRREMQLELKRIQKSTGTTFVYVTHDQEEALTMSDRIAVMEGGVVQQLADPRTLYEQPRTAFVAGFIGTSNSIGLEVSHREGELAVMELGEGMRVVAPDPGGSAARLQITVRPEKISFGAGDNGAGSLIRGRVVEHIYLGSLSQTVVEIATGERLVVHELNDDEATAVAAGDEVTLCWADRHSLVVDTGDSPQTEEAR